MNQIVPVTQNVPSAIVWPSEAVALMQLCKELAQARTLPQWCSRSPADLFFAVQSFVRLKLDPFMSLKHVSQIRNNLFFDGMLCAAMLHNSGKLATNLGYEFTGTGDDRTVIVSARLNNETEVRTVKVRLGDVKTTGNENWTKNPDQQLSYNGARTWGRRHCPEVLLGLLFDDDPMIDITPVATTVKTVATAPPKIDPSMTHDQRSNAVEIEAALKEHAELHPPTEDRVPDTEPSEIERANTEPHELNRTDDSAQAWSAWATMLMAYVRAAPDVDTINNWTTENAKHLAALKQHDAAKHKRLTGMIDHQIAIRGEQEK